MTNIFPQRPIPIIIKKEIGQDRYSVSSSFLPSNKKIYLNSSAKEVLLMCSGIINIKKIINNIAVKFTGSTFEEVKKETFLILDQLVKLDIIELLNSPIKSCEITVNNSLFSLELIYLEVTRACNLHCIHCYNEAGEIRKNELKTNDFLKIINTLNNIGVKNIILTGGEPFIRKDIFQIINEIHKKDIKFSIFTNGILITLKIIDKLLKYPPQFIAISLDGANRALHEKIRDHNTFDKTINVIKLLKSSGLKVRVNHTLTIESIAQLDKFMNLMKDLEIDDIFFDRFDYLGRGKEHKNMVIPLNYGHKVKSIIDKYTKDEKIEVRCYEAAVETGVDSMNLCGVGINSCYIKADGQVAFCPVLADEKFTIGNILQSEINSLWHSSKWNELRDACIENVPECKDCPQKSFCLGGCKAKAYNAFGSFSHPDPWACSQFRKK